MQNCSFAHSQRTASYMDFGVDSEVCYFILFYFGHLFYSGIIDRFYWWKIQCDEGEKSLDATLRH